MCVSVLFFNVYKRVPFRILAVARACIPLLHITRTAAHQPVTCNPNAAPSLHANHAAHLFPQSASSEGREVN
ncbi:hypothetical protein Csa_014461 [Cucumis sativus]|uniref:Uncharacterized protein n=1 Tax=Cucumis sativus TaxID=3659 RepID=A0A0A0KW60_CUCSA|nr:hypothetical protein Csa_014461 [Cucumis sativus]